MLLFYTLASAQYIQINESYTAQQLVEDVLINSTCASVSSFSVSGGNFSDGSKSYAYFSNNSPDFPFADGIVLSTGKASSTQGPNSYISDDGGGMGWTGDADLEAALNIGGTTNRTILEFDFTPLSNKISFDYIFASEEYHDNAQCQYSDGFAFLLKKVNGNDPYQNLALIPGTTIPVKVTTVHPQVPGGCPAQNPTYFGSYNDVNYPINFNGQTVVMTAQSVVEPGELYHIKLVIADEGNFRYDSAIFLGGGSFNVETDLGPNRLVSNGNPLCNGETIVLDATQGGTNTYQWFLNGNPITNATNPTYTVTAAGTYTVEVNINGSCLSTGKVIIEYPSNTINNATLTQCDDNGDGVTTFNLTNAGQIITGGSTQLTILGYYPSLTDAQNGQNGITNTQSFQNTTTNTVTVKVKNQFNCILYATISLQIANNPINAINPVEICDADTVQNGLSQFDLNTITQRIQTNNTFPGTVTIQYFKNQQDALALTNPLPTPYPNITPFQQIIYARIINGSDCYGILPVTLVVNTFSPLNFQDELRPLCLGNTIDLDAGSGFNTYSWDTVPVQNSQSISVNQAGNYTVTVTNAKGCSRDKTFFVIASESPTITNISVESFSGQGNSITVHVTGIGNYQYSLDGINYQDSNFFTDLNPGQYTVYVNDKNHCGSDSQTAYVLDYPHFFTPNGDGYNDTWKIKNLNVDYPNSELFIFNRYGKLLKQLSAFDEGWNGQFNNQQLPSDDYWFTLQLENGKIIKGHFAMKR